MFIFYFVYTTHQVLLICNENKEICVANLMIEWRSFPLNKYFFGLCSVVLTIPIVLKNLNSKSTALDRLYGPAWLAFGHSFAAEGEHDQAHGSLLHSVQAHEGVRTGV